MSPPPSPSSAAVQLSACVVVVGFSRVHAKNVMLLLQHARTGLWMFPGGYEEPRDASRHHTAARELVEEVQGFSEDLSVDPGNRLLEAAVRRQVWLGPYGTAPYVPHMAFVLINDGSFLPEMDALVRAFRRNSECAAIALAPVASVDGNAMTLPTATLGQVQLRVRVGYLRARALRQLHAEGRIPRPDGARGSSSGHDGSDGHDGGGGDGGNQASNGSGTAAPPAAQRAVNARSSAPNTHHSRAPTEGPRATTWVSGHAFEGDGRVDDWRRTREREGLDEACSRVFKPSAWLYTLLLLWADGRG